MTAGVPGPDPAAPVLAGDEPARPRTHPAGRAGALVALAVAVALLGVPLGLLWSAVAPDVPIRVTDSGAAFAEAQPQQLVAADGWFTVLGAPFGALVAIGAWWVTRTRGVAGLLVTAAGAVAAGVLAWLVGRQLGLAGYQAALAGAAPGTELARPPELRAVQAQWWPPLVTGAPLVPALAAAITYTLLAAWARFPDLRPGNWAAGSGRWEDT